MKTPETNVDTTLRILDELLGKDIGRTVGVRLWEGTAWPDDAPRPVTLELKHPSALRAMFQSGTELGLAEAYLYDDFDICGDVEALCGMADRLTAIAAKWGKKLRVARRLMQLPSSPDRPVARRGRARLTGARHSIERDRQAVTYHYDVSNDFYALWLDRSMTYSCAYFLDPYDDLDTAQARKLDYICRKLRLRPGQRLLDLGCGWGGLVMFAARHYGVDATGITLSVPQAEWANRRIAESGLADHARVEVRDYRELESAAGERHDALVSVGMFEHVGAEKLPTYFAQAWRLLKPGGAFLNHGIACRADAPDSPITGFAGTYVFPDGELTPLHATLEAAESAAFEVRDVESLREHYALTLRHWVRRLEANHDEALRHVDEATYRVWRLYMSGSAQRFTTGQVTIYQTLLVKPDSQGQSGLPLSRADWHAPGKAIFEKNVPPSK